MGLFKALKILGYKSYHNIEAASRGKRDFPMISKAMIAEKDPSTPSFGRKEFDELWGDYDASPLLPQSTTSIIIPRSHP